MVAGNYSLSLILFVVFAIISIAPLFKTTSIKEMENKTKYGLRATSIFMILAALVLSLFFLVVLNFEINFNMFGIVIPAIVGYMLVSNAVLGDDIKDKKANRKSKWRRLVFPLFGIVCIAVSAATLALLVNPWTTDKNLNFRAGIDDDDGVRFIRDLFVDTAWFTPLALSVVGVALVFMVWTVYIAYNYMEAKAPGKSTTPAKYNQQ